MGSVTWVIIIVVLADLVFVPFLVFALVRGMWSPLADRHPAQPIAPDAVRRNFQSYKIGLMNLGGMLHTAVDERYLHLLPAAVGRWARMRPVSIPWEAIQPVRRRGRRYAEVKIGTDRVIGPAWALDLAFDDPPSDGGDAEVQ